MAAFRKGAEAVQAAATRSGGGKFTPTHRFEAGETKYLQFLTSMDETYTVLMHRFVTVGHKENGDPKYADFISRRDPSLDGPDGYDPLADRFGLSPSNRTIGVALELIPKWKQNGTKKVLAGFEPAMRTFTNKDDEEVEVANIALVVESPFTFYTHLTAFADLKPIEDVVFAVKRTGKSTDTQYTFIEAGTALDDDVIGEYVEEFLENFDIEEYLEGLADEEKVHELIDPLPDDFVVSRFAKKGKNQKSEKAEKSSSTRTRKATVRDEEPEAEAGDEQEDVTTEAAADEDTPAPRKRRFSELRKDMSK